MSLDHNWDVYLFKSEVLVQQGAVVPHLTNGGGRCVRVTKAHKLRREVILKLVVGFPSL